jgi:hypothetical protein
MNQGPRCVLFMEKNGGWKSHATVPLTPIFPLNHLPLREGSPSCPCSRLALCPSNCSSSTTYMQTSLPFFILIHKITHFSREPFLVQPMLQNISGNAWNIKKSAFTLIFWSNEDILVWRIMRFLNVHVLMIKTDNGLQSKASTAGNSWNF